MSRRKKRELLASLNLLELKPVRLANWKEVAGRMVIERPEPTTTGLRKRLDIVAHLMSTRWIRLDRMGSHAWQFFDGTMTVGDAATRLRETFGEDVEPAEERLGHLVRMLHSQQLLGYPEFDNPQAMAMAGTACRIEEASG